VARKRRLSKKECERKIQRWLPGIESSMTWILDRKKRSDFFSCRWFDKHNGYWCLNYKGKIFYLLYSWTSIAKRDNLESDRRVPASWHLESRKAKILGRARNLQDLKLTLIAYLMTGEGE
jgi:hypothetical protein